MATYVGKCSLWDFVVIMVNKTHHLYHIEIVETNRQSKTTQEPAVDMGVHLTHGGLKMVSDSHSTEEKAELIGGVAGG